MVTSWSSAVEWVVDRDDPGDVGVQPPGAIAVGLGERRVRPRVMRFVALLAPGALFTALAACEDAGDAVALLRGRGGLDDWFTESDRMSGVDRFESDSLERAQLEATGRSPREYLSQLVEQAKQLKLIRDKDDGLELTTIHRSEGRQWPHVIVVACDSDVLPHRRSIKVSAADVARGEGLEAERRLAYVAFTRAEAHLELVFDKRKPSSFLTEAGLLTASASRRSRPPREAPPLPRQPRTAHARSSVYLDATALAHRAAEHPAPATGVAAAQAGADARGSRTFGGTPADDHRRTTAVLVAQRRMRRPHTQSTTAQEDHHGVHEHHHERPPGRSRIIDLDHRGSGTHGPSP